MESTPPSDAQLDAAVSPTQGLALEASPASFDPKTYVAALPARPGIYRMLDAAGTIIYVGKAANLRSRVASYFRADVLQPKVVALVRQIAGIEVTVTDSETEALLLECNLIKKHRPHYNVLLKDDKSFPFIHITTQQRFARISFYRGSRRGPGRFFGPFPNSVAVRETLSQLQKLFRVRQCEDSYFENRSRACLQYQIKRCSGSCVGHISESDYAEDVESVIRVLEGRDQEVANRLGQRMETAATALEFEKAAVLRDQLAALKTVQASQIVSASADVDCDVVSVVTGATLHAIGVMFVRAGRSLGTTTYYARAHLADADEIVEAFLVQHYLVHEAPAELVLTHRPKEGALLSTALSERAGHKVTLHVPSRGIKVRWLEMTRDNAEQGLRLRLATEAGIGAQLADLGRALGLETAPGRLECFDISHTQGEATVASCVVLGAEGPIKADYRRFNVTPEAPGDDYASMREALTRRYKRVKAGEAKIPDVLLIDGGPYQLAEAVRVLDELQVVVPRVVGVAKGADRRPGQERLFLPANDTPLILAPDSRALHVVQRVRDEAHRFAIAGHRARRSKARQASVLEEVPGLGPARRRELLKRFGGLQGILGAGIGDLAAVPGIGPRVAEAIYQHLHPDQ
jgi:excinuclease ABC subunit C